ncbi:MAG: hypothetical protein ACRDK3_12605 [Actinomycetota bacterium]
MARSFEATPKGSPLDAKQLLRMSKVDLDELFSQSPAGEIPRGRGRGTVLFAPGTPIAQAVAKFAYAIAWRGKVFNQQREDLLNIVTPFGVQAIRARVYRDPSWIDQRECIVLDYSQTSRVARWIRDEIRAVAPGVYLGQVFWSRSRILRFALAFPAE